MDAPLLLVVVFFAGMGLVALIAPRRIGATFDAPEPSPAGRLVSAMIERPGRFYPSWFYCLLELAMAAVLWRGVA